jgi:HK97 family phage major capsid protein
METVKAVQEEVDALRIEARAINSVATCEGRDMDERECARFDELTDRLIPDAEKRLEKALKLEDKVVQLSTQTRRREKLDEIDSALSRQGRPPRVLPTDGIAASGNQPRQQYHRLGKLKYFESEAEAYNCGMWLRAVVGKEYNRPDPEAEAHIRRLGWAESNAGIEGDPTKGGYLVPAPLSSAIIDVREKVGVMRGLVKVMPMTSDRLDIGRRSSGLTVYGGTENPAADMTASDKGWSQIKLIAEKRYVVHQISAELVDDALIPVVQDAVEEMGYALALAEDDEIINGTGTSAYRGVVGLLSKIGSAGVSTAATGHDTWGELDISDVTACMGLLPDEYATEPAWVCSRAFYYNVMLRIQAAAGGNSIQTIQAGDGGRRTFMGDPVYFTNRMPKATAVATVCALYGTFSQAVMLGDRGGIRIARSDDFAFLRDLTTIKATSRYDVQVHAPGSASAAGGYVALKTAS